MTATELDERDIAQLAHDLRGARLGIPQYHDGMEEGFSCEELAEYLLKLGYRRAAQRPAAPVVEPEKCLNCLGTGVLPQPFNGNEIKCLLCNGTGIVPAAHLDRTAAPGLGLSPRMTGHTLKCRAGDGWPCDCGYVIGPDHTAALEDVAVAARTYADTGTLGAWRSLSDELANLRAAQTEERK